MNIYFRSEFMRVFGTWPLKDDVLRRAMMAAIEVGYRAFDTAQMYGNEAEVGETLAASGLARDRVCVTTKVMAANFSEARFLNSVEESLKALRLDHVDALLLHWPPADDDIAPSLKLLEQALRRGLARNIGVSNYNSQRLRRIRSVIDAPIVTNQVEFHPLLNQDILMAAAIETGIPLSAYCSIARGEIFQVPDFADIGKMYGRAVGQVALRWILQKGVIPVTMSTNPQNIRSNFDILDFTLSHIDMRRIDELTKTSYRVVNREIVPTIPDWD